MRSARAALLVVLLGAACVKQPAETPGSSASSIVVEPRSERQVELAEIDLGKSKCSLAVDAWDAARPGCRVSATTCGSSVMDTACTASETKQIACAASETMCGRELTCQCPTGAPRPLDDPPGTVVVHATGGTATWGAGDCTARQVPGQKDQCEWMEDTCHSGKPCESVRHAMSCGLLRDGCGRRVRCLCH